MVYDGVNSNGDRQIHAVCYRFLSYRNSTVTHHNVGQKRPSCVAGLEETGGTRERSSLTCAWRLSAAAAREGAAREDPAERNMATSRGRLGTRDRATRHTTDTADTAQPSLVGTAFWVVRLVPKVRRFRSGTKWFSDVNSTLPSHHSHLLRRRALTSSHRSAVGRHPCFRHRQGCASWPRH